MNIKILQDLGLEEITIDQGVVILHQGKRQQKVYVLIKGRVEVRAGEHEIADINAPGTIFGEISALLGTDHVADVITAESSQFYVIENFRDFFIQHPDAGLGVAQLLACRLVTMNNHFVAIKDQLGKMQKNLENYLPVFPKELS